MNEEVTQKNYGGLVKIAVLSVVLFQYIKGFTTASLGAIAQAFPNVDPLMIKQIESIPSLIAVPAALAVGILERFMSKRMIVNIAMLCTLVGGIGPGFCHDFNNILIFRVIFGIGRGMVFTLATSLIADLFTGNARDTMFGYKITFGCITGSLTQLAGGALAAISWQYSFFGYAIAIPFIALVIWKLPEPEVKPAVIKSGQKAPLTTKFWVITALGLLYNVCMFAFMTNTAIVIAANKVGSPALAGVVLTCFTLVSAVSAAFYGKFTLKVLKEYTIVVALLLVGGAFLFLTQATSITMFYIGAGLYGLGWGTVNPELYKYVVTSVPRESGTLSLSIFTATQNCGQFLSPLFLAFCTGLVGIKGALAPWQVSGTIIVAGAVLLAIAVAYSKSKKKADPSIPA